MPEEQAFSVLVKIMSDYGLRDLFKSDFEELHLKFYQLERLMQVLIYHGLLMGKVAEWSVRHNDPGASHLYSRCKFKSISYWPLRF